MTNTHDTPDSTGTRASLIAAALYLFGHRGYEGTSIRAIATRAGVNVASIAYHFGGKAGLRMACAETVAAKIAQTLPASGDAPVPADPAAAMAEIERAVRNLAGALLMAPQAGDFVPFMLREITDPGEVAEMIFANFLLPRHERLCQLWAVVTGKEPEAPEVKLALFAVIGQVLYFRIAQPFVSRRMGWDRVGQGEVKQITDIIIEGLRARAERKRS
ncbi:CerR family C-terminal domain-containing protein [Aquicoccus sp. G2-2]|uniref:CerR family C-terminal domain-containing protein n=1 Tax=Aquicoccus sp. G2-2 TaxID=3092120 RepID=UPI002ADF1D74|nr:CerR family C-terminal domain-containing protein [Aquicoccus sp. G2-2]MEA1112967.1 CerR family C-terminal domain-containing protein [Aquicoccus sp. G2-2]